MPNPNDPNFVTDSSAPKGKAKDATLNPPGTPPGQTQVEFGHFEGPKTSQTKTGSDMKDMFSGRVPGAAPARDKVIYRNGIYMHIHPGYPKGATKESEQKYHPVSQKHRGEGGKDITQKLHVMAGLGANGMGGMTPSWRQTIVAVTGLNGRDLKSKTASLVGALAVAGISNVGNMYGAMFDLGKAMMSGNPMSIASKAIGGSLDVFTSVAEETVRLRDKYRIPSEADSEYVRQTILGRAFAGQQEAYNDGYKKSMGGSNAYISLAADMSIVDPATGDSLYKQYAGTDAMPTTAADLEDAMRKRDAFLMAAGYKVNGKNYEDAFAEGLANINDDAAVSMTNAIYSRNNDYLKAMEELVVNDRAYHMDDNGFIDFSSPVAMTDAEKEKYKIALQVGNRLASEQLSSINSSIKTSVKERRADLSQTRAAMRAHAARIKAIEEARKEENIKNGGMHVKVAYDLGMNTEVDKEFNPITYTNLREGTKKLKAEIEANEKARKILESQGIKSEADQKARGVYTKQEVKDAEDRLILWDDMATRLRAESLQRRNNAESRRLNQMDAVSQVKSRFKNLDADGLPLNENSLKNYQSALRKKLVAWDSDSKHMHANLRSDKSLMNIGIMNIANDASAALGGTKTAAELYSRLTKSPANSLQLEEMKNWTRAESIRDPAARNDYIALSNEDLKARAKARIESINNTQYTNRAIDRMDTDQFTACMDEIRRQYNEMSAEADEATANGEMYDPGKFNKMWEHIYDMDSAVKNHLDIRPADIQEPAGTYKFNAGDARKYLVDKLVEAAKDDGGDFYHGDDRMSDSDLNKLFNGVKLTGDKSRRINDVLDNMSVRGISVDENNIANHYLAFAGTYTGSPFSFKIDGKQGSSDKLSNAIRREAGAYQKYMNEKYAGGVAKDDDAMAFAMEAHLDYLGKKLAVNEMLLNDKSLSDMDRRELQGYAESLDKDAARRMLNLEYDAVSKDFGKGRDYNAPFSQKAAKQAMELMGNDSENVLLTYRRQIDQEIGGRLGFMRSMDEVADSVSGMGKPWTGTLGMTSEGFGDFFGADTSKNAYQIKTEIQDRYGFDMDNAMDHMAVMALKKIGIESIDDLKNLGEDSYRSYSNKLDKLITNYEQTQMLDTNGDEDYGRKNALVKSVIVAYNTVNAMEARQRMLNSVLEGKLQWIGNDPRSNEELMSDASEAYDKIFKTVKEMLWAQGTIAGSLDNYSDIVKMDKEDANMMAGSSVMYGALGIDPSLLQGTTAVHDAKVDKVKDFIMKGIVKNGVIQENIVNSYDNRLNNGEMVAMTLSGTFGPYQMGSADPTKMSIPIELYSTAMGLFGKKYGDLLEEVNNLREDSVALDISSWKDQNKWQNGKAPNIVDLSIMFYREKDKDGNPTGQVRSLITPIVLSKEKGKKVRKYLMTADMVIHKMNNPMTDFDSLLGMSQYGKKTGQAPQQQGNANLLALNPSPITLSASSPKPWSEDSIAKADEPTGYENGYMPRGLETLVATYRPEAVGGKVLNNLPYPCGVRKGSLCVLVNGTKDAVLASEYGDKYVSRRYGVIDCGEAVQTLGGEQVFVTFPWEKVKITPPCLFFGLLDVFVPGEPDGFEDPRVVMEASRTSPDFDKAVDAVRIIRDFGGLYDSPSIDADQTARGIRNIIIRAYAEVGAFGGAVFDRMRSMAESLPPLNMENYFTVARAAFRLARSLDIYECRSREAWHLLKGLRSNALLAISANRFMEYRRRYASSRPEVDAIAYIGTDEGKGERELDVKDMLMLIGLMAACELKPLLPFIPRFYEDMDARWGDAADYWYIMMHHEPEPVPEVEEEASEESP